MNKKFIKKKMFYTKFISKNKSNPKKIVEIIDFAISTKHVNFLLIKINIENSVKDDPPKTADCLNQFFVEIGHYMANNIITSFFTQTHSMHNHFARSNN